VDKVGLRLVFLQALRFSLLNIFTPIIRTHLHMHAALASRTNDRSLGTIQKESSFGNPSALDTKVRTFTFLLLKDFKTEAKT